MSVPFFTRTLAKESGLSQKDVKKVLDALPGSLSETLNSGETAQIRGLGRFSTINVAEREVRSFGKEITVPAHKRLKFSVSESFKKSIN